jgi:divalent metal cation (Fe/Co/Zn/Cd) transporter
MPAAQAHAIAHKVQDRLTGDLEGIQDVVIHIEPQEETGVPGGVSGTFRQLAAELGLAIHDLRAYGLGGDLYADLHVEVPGDLTLGEAHERSSALIEAAHQSFPGLREMITHIEPAPRGVRVEELGQKEAEDVKRMAEEVAAEWFDSYHKVLVRRLGDDLSLALHCQMPPDTPIEEAHALSQRVETALRARIPQLGRAVIHMEPGHSDRGESPEA